MEPKFTLRLLKGLLSHPNVETLYLNNLNLSGFKISDLRFGAKPKFVSLEESIISYSLFKSLLRDDSIQGLDLCFFRLSDHNIDISNITLSSKLDNISLDNEYSNIPKLFIKQLLGHHSIKNFHLRDFDFEDFDISDIPLGDKLTDVMLEYASNLSSSDIKHVFSHPSIESVSLFEFNFEGLDISDISLGPKLNRVVLHLAENVPIELIRLLLSHDNIEELDFYNVDLAGININGLRLGSKLKTLWAKNISEGLLGLLQTNRVVVHNGG